MRSALGKGLDALISQDTVNSVAASPAAKAAPTTLPLDRIRSNPKQPRREFSEEALNELAASIKKRGVLQPIVVTPVQRPMSKVQGQTDSKENLGPGTLDLGPTYEIIAGERRWRAAQRAGLKDIPVVIRQGTEAERFELALIENLQRENLNPIELALGYQRLQDEFHLTQEAIAEVVGKDRTVVANTLRLLTLSPSIQQALSSGVISAGHGKALLSVENEAEREALFVRITTENLTVRSVESAARATKKKLIREHAAASGYETRPPEIRALEEELQHALGRKVEIHGGQAPSHKGFMKLEFYSLDDFDALMARFREGKG